MSEEFLSYFVLNYSSSSFFFLPRSLNPSPPAPRDATAMLCLHFSRMYGGLFDFRRFVLLTSEKKRHGTDQGSLEVAENLLAQKVDVTVIDFAPQIMPNVIDPDIAS